MAFRRSMTTEELVTWLSEKGLHPDDCTKLKDEKFTGESFLILKKDDFKELGITGFASKRLLEKLVEEACAQSSDSPPDSEAVDAATATVNSNTSTVQCSVNNFEGLSSDKVLELVDDTAVLNVDDDSKDVLDYLNEVAGHWEAICRNVHVKNSKIEELTNSGRPGPYCLGQAITDWLKLNYNHQRFGKPSWKKVAESVVKLNNGLFLRIASEHPAPGVKIVRDSDQGQQAVDVDVKMSALTVAKSQGTNRAKGVLDLDIHLQPLKKAVLEVAYEWKNIGRSLPGVTEGNIRSIRFREDNECLNEVLSKWIATGNAKTTDLLTALEDPPVSRTDIANKIRALEGEERANVGL